MKALMTIVCLLLSMLLAACSESHPSRQAPLSDFTQTTAGHLIWSNDIGKGGQTLATHLQPAADGNILYTASSEGLVSAINIDSGNIRWQYNYHFIFTSDVGQDDQSIYIGSQEGYIAKIDKNSGQLQWQALVSNTVIAAPASKDNVLLIKTINGNLLALRADSGQPLWSSQQTVPPLVLRDASSARFYQNKAIVGFANGSLHSLDIQTGEDLWDIPLSIPHGKTDVERMIDVDASPIIDGNTIYTATYQGNITSLNAANGAINWEKPISAYNNLSMNEQDIYASDADSYVWAFDKDTGRVLWKQTRLKYRQLSGPAAINNYVVVGDHEGYLHIMSKTDGQFVARFKLNNSGISATPIIVGQTVIVLCNNGELYAYRLG